MPQALEFIPLFTSQQHIGSASIGTEVPRSCHYCFRTMLFEVLAGEVTNSVALAPPAGPRISYYESIDIFYSEYSKEMLAN
jgi:hypothetical protein